MAEKVWYIQAPSGQEEGPFTLEEISRRIGNGELSEEILIWIDPNQKMSYREVEALSTQNTDYPNPTPREQYATQSKEDFMKNENQAKPHPWRRFWARMLDYTIYGFVLGILFALFGIIVPQVYLGLVGIGLIFLWTFIEAGFLCTWGKTPGKALLAMDVLKKDGSKLSYLEGINRSFSVWWLGLGAAIYPISVITMIVACTKLANLGETTWDKKGGYTVSYGRVGPLRVIIVILLFIVLLGIAQSGYQS